MKITAQDVAKLRKMTGAGMMDCKKALVEAEGDFDKAQEIIREKGKLVAAKRADRETSEGAVIAKVGDDHRHGVLVCLGCETDFVSSTKDFKQLAQGIADVAFKEGAKDVDALKSCKIGDSTVEEAISEQVGKSGEKHVLACCNTLDAPYISAYNHINGKVSAMVAFNKVVPESMGHEIAMQVTAMNPISVNKDDCPKDVIEREMEIYRQQVKEEGKPEAMAERISQGKLNKFFKENTLEEQEFVRDGKITVRDYMKSVDPEARVIAFRRYNLNDD
ncbi:MAG: translation elongation factor Ts [Bacteroidales bacterium]|jgi:elongation factor Ts|nr:translation elongation factor Ts [Bacteroidales bacterium]MCI2121117.1 translation elongation factor Ts [Bacteroidales bacterium]MCI2144932.1 translation elongation factor Ts [Bacteroidales bacterium]